MRPDCGAAGRGSNAPLRIVQVTETINEGAGGTATYICKVAEEVAELGVGRVELVALDLPFLEAPLKLSPKVETRLFPRHKPYLYGRSRALARMVEEAAADPATVFHIHNLWRLPMVHAAAAARRHGRPWVASVHGALDPWALKFNPWPKKLFWPLLERPRLQRASVLQVLSSLEADYIRAQLPKANIAIVPSGTVLPDLAARGGPDRPNTALFLSRLHPRKLLPVLLQAWAVAKPSGWRLEVCGQDQGDLEKCRRIAHDLRLDQVVAFRGFVENKWEPYLNADLFVLPSVGENFGIVVIEALASGLPVITSRDAPWGELVSRECGWWIDHGVEPLAAALREATGLGRAALAEMGLRGRKLVEEKYTWPQVARRMAELYQWLGGGSRPDWVLVP